jgi:hypothetical protein
MSKGYTISFFMRALEGTDKRMVSFEHIYNIISPRIGFFSVKSEQFDTWLYNNTLDIYCGVGKFKKFGSYPKQRLMKALKLRKAGKLLDFIDND